MSIEGISNYQYQVFESTRPEWQKIERYDFCDQDVHPARHHYFGKLVSFVRHMIG